MTPKLIGHHFIQTADKDKNVRWKMEKLDRLIGLGVRDPRIHALAGLITRNVPSKDDWAEINAVHNAVTNRVAYRSDPVASGISSPWGNRPPKHIETFSHPYYAWKFRRGDCDDLVGLEASLYTSLGFPFILKAVGPKGTGGYAHIYGMVGVPKRSPRRWVPVDAAARNPTRPPGWEPDSKKVGRTMLRPVTGGDMALGYADQDIFQSARVQPTERAERKQLRVDFRTGRLLSPPKAGGRPDYEASLAPRLTPPTVRARPLRRLPFPSVGGRPGTFAVRGGGMRFVDRTNAVIPSLDRALAAEEDILDDYESEAGLEGIRLKFKVPPPRKLLRKLAPPARTLAAARNKMRLLSRGLKAVGKKLTISPANAFRLALYSGNLPLAMRLYVKHGEKTLEKLSPKMRDAIKKAVPPDKRAKYEKILVALTVVVAGAVVIAVYAGPALMPYLKAGASWVVKMGKGVITRGGVMQLFSKVLGKKTGTPEMPSQEALDVAPEPSEGEPVTAVSPEEKAITEKVDEKVEEGPPARGFFK